ncbi:MAG: twin-arginine translocase subunit TatC [Alphaproteobacteria bacterium]
MSGDNDKKMSLLDHLIELRNRLMWAAGILFVVFIGCYAVADYLFAFLVQPLAEIYGEQTGRRLIYTGLTEVFFTYVKIAFFAALGLSFPVIATQIWAFVAPGLYRHEKKVFLPFLIATPVLFAAGAALVYYAVIPLAWEFFLSFETQGLAGSLPIQLEAKVNEYLSLVMKLMFAFGLCFQLPVLLVLLARIGAVTSAGLAAKRKYALIAIFIVAAILTPPDVISQVSLALPVLLLYEISILAVRLTEKRQREAASTSETSAD